jgi:hypothetical protein
VVFIHNGIFLSHWRTSSYTNLARLRRPKIAFSSSYVDYRAKTNAIVLLDMGHTLRGEYTGGTGKGKRI